jgi:hypothetical protein
MALAEGSFLLAAKADLSTREVSEQHKSGWCFRSSSFCQNPVICRLCECRPRSYRVSNASESPGFPNRRRMSSMALAEGSFLLAAKADLSTRGPVRALTSSAAVDHSRGCVSPGSNVGGLGSASDHRDKFAENHLSAVEQSLVDQTPFRRDPQVETEGGIKKGSGASADVVCRS